MSKTDFQLNDTPYCHGLGKQNLQSCPSVCCSLQRLYILLRLKVLEHVQR